MTTPTSPPPFSPVPHSRWCTAAPPELPFLFPRLDEMPLKAAGAADGSVACHDRSAKISGCIIFPWWSCSETGWQRVLFISHFGSSTAHLVPEMSNGWQERDIKGREGEWEVGRICAVMQQIQMPSFLPCSSGHLIRQSICCLCSKAFSSSQKWNFRATSGLPLWNVKFNFELYKPLIVSANDFANRNVRSPLEGINGQIVTAMWREKKLEKRDTVSTEVCGTFRGIKCWQHYSLHFTWN